MKILKYKKISIILLTLLCIGLLISPTNSIAGKDNNSFEDLKLNKSIIFEQNFSEPTINKNGKYLEVKVDETNSRLFSQGSADLAVLRKTFEFNWNVCINHINFSHSEIENIDIKEDSIKSVPIFKDINTAYYRTNKNIGYKILEDDDNLYPNSWYSIEKSAGLNSDGKHVVFLTINIYPIRHNKEEKNLEYIENVRVEIDYIDSTVEFLDPDIYDLVIITPVQFKNNLSKLLVHKEKYGVKTNITTLKEIYENYQGRDHTEQIKYFIKSAIEKWGVEFVLLVGEMRITPIRQTDAYPWDGMHGEGLLSDLYYGDIYDSDYNFSSWDSNEDMIFGEIDFNGSGHLGKATIIDKVDLYPDVHVGRLACRNKDEVDIVVEKIINYETITYGKDWFKKIILAGGDTFPPATGSSFNIFEGEITNDVVAKELPSDFEHIKLWTSKNNLNAFTFNRNINKGAGFVSYAGHGFEHGWGTFKPNQMIERIVFFGSSYFIPFIQFLKNKDRLPIIFFDACLTAKLDFNANNLFCYYNSLRKLQRLIGIEINTNNHFPCFAWCFLTEKDGGAIGTIGATRPAYAYVNDKGEKVHAGAVYLDQMFFRGYEEGRTLGEMMSYAQTSYLKNRFMDYFTIEEYILLGDPSLMVGGYPSN